MSPHQDHLALSPLELGLMVVDHHAISEALTVVGANAAAFPRAEMQMLSIEQANAGEPDAKGHFRVDVLLSWTFDPMEKEAADERTAVAAGTFLDGTVLLSSIELDLDRGAMQHSA